MNIKKLFDYSVPLTAAATVLVLGGVIVSLIGARTAFQIKLANDSIEVTGSAKQAVEADMARWVINLETRTEVNDQQNGYRTIETATKQITNYLETQDLTDYETPAITSYANYTYPQNGSPYLNGFSVNRQIIVRSNDIDKINEIANAIDPLTGAGYNVSTQSVEFTYSKLAEARVTLLSDAIKDAKARAEAIASESGRNIRTLRSASSGVVQVLPQGGIDISDYGTYDTQSLHKDIMVTVRASFELK